MSFSIGQMNSLLKKYTDTLLALHGIPVNGEFDTDFEKFAEHTTARKSLETALWKLTEENEGLHEQVKKLEHDAVYEATEGVRELSRKIYQECQQELAEQHKEHKEQVKGDCWYRLRNIEAERQLKEAEYEAYQVSQANDTLAHAIKDLRDHIANSSGDADERAERHEAILELADGLMKEYGLEPMKFREYPPYTPIDEPSEDEETDEE